MSINKIDKDIKITKENFKDVIQNHCHGKYIPLEEMDTLKKKIKFHCNVHNGEFEKSVYDIVRRGYGCPCEVEDGKTKEMLFNEIKREIEKHYGFQPYKFLSEFKGTSKKMKVECIKGHKFDVTIANIRENIKFNRNYYCPKCSNEKMKVTKSKDFNHYKKLIKENNGEKYYKLDSNDYINMQTPMKHVCDKGHKFTAIPSNIICALQKGRKYCPECNNMKRYMQPTIEELPFNYGLQSCKEGILDLLIENNIDFNVDNENIYIDSKDLSISIDSLEDNNEEYKGRKYHLDKTKACEDKDLKLLHVYDDEWINKKDIIADKILANLGIYNEKIYARNCICKIENDNKLIKEFLDNNHIQGHNNSAKYNFSLYYNDEIVAIMNFSLIRYDNDKDNKLELLRFAVKKGTSVLGGFGKLLKFAINNIPSNIISIISYADRRYSSINNSVYKTTGFKLIGCTKPSYIYFNKNTKEVASRYKFQKTKLKDLFPQNYDENKTEFEIMDSTKLWKRIWDCGNLKYEYKIKR